MDPPRGSFAAIFSQGATTPNLDAENGEVLCAVHATASSLLPSSAGLSTVGVALFDTRTFKLSVCQFQSNNHLTVLESLMLQVHPKIVVSAMTETTAVNSNSNSLLLWQTKLSAIVSQCGSGIEYVSKKVFDTSTLEQDISYLLKEKDTVKNHRKQLDLQIACAAAAALIHHWQLLNRDDYVHQCEFITYPLDAFLRLDTAATAALHVFPENIITTVLKWGTNKHASSSSISLYGLLNRHCVCKLGSRTLYNWLSQPLVDPVMIRLRHDIVEAFTNDETFRRQIHTQHFKHIIDLDLLAGKLHRIAASMNLDDIKKSVSLKKTNVTLEDIVKLYDCIIECKSLEEHLKDYCMNSKNINAKSVDILLLQPLREVLKGFVPYIDLINFTIDMDEATLGYYVISRRFEPKLTELQQSKEKTRQHMEKLRNKIHHDIPFDRKSSSVSDPVKLMEDNTFGFVFRVTKKDQSAVETRKNRYQQIRLNKNEFLFTCNELRSLCREYRDACDEYDQAQLTLVDKALRVAATYWPLVERLSDILGTLDVLGAFACASSSTSTRYTRPVILEGGKGVKMIDCRHALVESLIGGGAFISNDVLMDHNSRFHIITGPNMGGKSTYIRQVALTVLMAQIGCFVPCKECELPVFTQIMCRVGASDCQLKGISTFFAEMVEAAAILKTATERSLVIIDELGRGTSTFEGFGLAWAIGKHLVENIKCYSMFATHFHEMSRLSDFVEGVVNKHVTASVYPELKTLTFLYELRDGCADQSYGVNVAEFAGLPNDVVANANKKSIELETVERRQTKKPYLSAPERGTDGNISILENGDSRGSSVKKMKTMMNDIFSSDSENVFLERVTENIVNLEDQIALIAL